MASVFVLGSSHWENREKDGLTPWDTRRKIVSILREI
jgi:hypothetical protein